jgi:hypothetical protein
MLTQDRIELFKKIAAKLEAGVIKADNFYSDDDVTRYLDSGGDLKETVDEQTLMDHALKARVENNSDILNLLSELGVAFSAPPPYDAPSAPFAEPSSEEVLNQIRLVIENILNKKDPDGLDELLKMERLDEFINVPVEVKQIDKGYTVTLHKSMTLLHALARSGRADDVTNLL